MMAWRPGGKGEEGRKNMDGRKAGNMMKRKRRRKVKKCCLKGNEENQGMVFKGKGKKKEKREGRKIKKGKGE